MSELSDLRKALEPFANAYKRLRSYGDEPGDEVPLFANQVDTSFELLDGEDGPSVKVKDLRRAAELLK